MGTIGFISFMAIIYLIIIIIISISMVENSKDIADKFNNWETPTKRLFMPFIFFLQIILSIIFMPILIPLNWIYWIITGESLLK